MAGKKKVYTSVEICAGAGGQAIGLERAGFNHLALVEIDPHASNTLAANGEDMGWEGKIFPGDVRDFDPAAFKIKSGMIDLLAGGVPCPPFSLAGKQLGHADERDLFPTMLDLVEKLQPKAVMIENVRGLLQEKFDPYRAQLLDRLRGEGLGYIPVMWGQFDASDFGVPQLRPRSVLVALKPDYAGYFNPPRREDWVQPLRTVGEQLRMSMELRGMSEADVDLWAKRADHVAPTLVGGSKKHGGADLGPTRAKRQWELMGVDGHGVANDDEPATIEGPNGRGPRLTVRQAALIQGFPDDWKFAGGKTAQYRQVGNAFPPPVAATVAGWIMQALQGPGSGKEPPVKNPGVLPLPQPRSSARRRRGPDATKIEGQTSLL